MSFELAFTRLIALEGNYSNDPADLGGETVAGISRKNWPQWQGWDYVDAAKMQPGFPRSLARNAPLQGLIKAFYRREFWDVFDLDETPPVLAEEIFEQAVNLGVKKTAEHLQRTLNALNYQEKWGSDLKVDGVFGQSSSRRLRAAASEGREKAIEHGINGLQCAHYILLAEQKPAMRKFTAGWLARRG